MLDHRRHPLILATTALAAFSTASAPLLAQSAAPVARYEMKAETQSGMGAMGGGVGSALSMAFGGGGANQAQHSLLLELGSTRAAADGKPKADHFMPAGAKLGKSVALKTPTATPPGPMGEFQRPKGRMLIYWGCGEHAPKGQPVVIDFAKLAAGQVPPGLFSTNIPVDSWNLSGSRTYGRWPADDGKSAKPDSALPGAHRIAGNYSPEMSFTLANDFMAPLRASNVGQASGATLLSWTGIQNATGYYAFLIGGKSTGKGNEMTDIVWWTSSASREFGGGLSDWLSPGTVGRLVTSKVVMSPQTSTCIVPAEVKRDAPDFMFGTLTAFGPEESFAFPPKPANAKAAWNPEWTARIRHKSTTTFLVGMPEMGAAGQEQPQAECKPKKKKKGLGGLGGALGGAIGGIVGGSKGSDDGC